jgi:hypothetical protein
MPGRRALRGRRAGNPFFPTLMPAIDFQGADAGVVWNDFSPRVGVTYDLKGDGKNVFSSSYATYYGQMSPGQLSSQLAATGAVFVRYPGRRPTATLRAGQRGQHLGAVPQQEHGLRPGEPDQHARRPRSISNVKNDRTREFIVGFDRQLHRRWRSAQLHLAQVRSVPWNDRDNWTQRELPRRRLPGRPARGRALRAGDLLRADDRSCRRPNIYTNRRIVTATSTASS